MAHCKETEEYLAAAEVLDAIRPACISFAAGLRSIEPRINELRSLALQAQLAEADPGYCQHLNEAQEYVAGLCREVVELMGRLQRIAKLEEKVRAHSMRARANFAELERQRQALAHV